MKMPEKGLDRETVMEKLSQYRREDIPWREGKAFSYVFHASKEAEEVCKEAYASFLTENGLDPTSFPSLLRFENELVEMARHHLRGDENVVGNFTSGGTESIILAVKTARDWARANRPEITEPEMILPVTAHAAFFKAAHYLDVKPVVTLVDTETYRADIRAIKEAITENTILLVGSATSYAHGVVDPIEEMGRLAQEEDLLLHVDGCIGGFVLPFLRELGYDVPNFDFTIEGVTSISMDLHKYAYAAKGASIVLYRNKELRKHQIFACSEWTGYTVVNNTVQSSKSGGPMAGAWAVMNFIGRQGYLEIAKSLYQAREKIIEGVEKMEDLYLLGDPDMTLLAFASDTVNVFEIVDEMKEKGWHLQPQFEMAGSPVNFHITLIPANVPHVDQLLSDLEESVARAKESGGEEEVTAAGVQSFLENMNLEEMDDSDLAGLLSMAGIEGTSLPERMAPINGILNTLPPELKNRILTNFVNEMFQYQQ